MDVVNMVDMCLSNIDTLEIVVNGNRGLQLSDEDGDVMVFAWLSGIYIVMARVGFLLNTHCWRMVF